MEIRIDTSKDSKEDIRKAIAFLKTIAEDSATPECAPVQDNVLGGFFDAPSPEISQEKPAPEPIRDAPRPLPREKVSVSGLDTY
jgi:hypothetical protein